MNFSLEVLDEDPLGLNLFPVYAPKPFSMVRLEQVTDGYPLLSLVVTFPVTYFFYGSELTLSSPYIFSFKMRDDVIN